MATTLPVTFRASPLPSNFRGTPQQFLDALVARLSIESQDDLSFFVTGSVAPTSDVGPWLKDGITWYVWDVVTGAYIPEVIEFQSLRYILSQTAPDQATYTLWIELDGTGKAQAIKTYSAGAWHDIYEDAFADVNTNVQLALNTYPAQANLSGAQTLAIDTTYHKVLFNTTNIDPDAVWDTTNSRYLASVAGIYRASANLQIDNDSAVAADMELSIKIAVNGATGAPQCPTSGDATPSPNGARWYPKVTGLIQMAAGDYVETFLSGQDGVNSGDVTVAAASQMAVELVKVL